MMGRASRRVLFLLLCAAGLGQTTRAQTAPAVEAGGRTASLGQPRLWRWELGLGGGTALTDGSDAVWIRAVAGVYRPAINPVTKLAEVGFETYLGMRGVDADAGARALVRMPYLGTGVGGDYNLRSGRLDLLVTAHTPVRRGGLLARGSLLRIDWHPWPAHGLTLSVALPLGDPFAGRSRPIRDYVLVAGDFYTAADHHPVTGQLRAELDSLRTSARWIRRLVVPFLDQDGHRAHVAVARTARSIAELQSRLAQRSVDGEVRFFHAQLEHAFTVAAGDSVLGRTLARRSREILLADVLLPYNALLGRKKRNDTLKALSVAARGRFARWVAASPQVSTARVEDVLFVFQRLTEILESERSTAAIEWDDPRLVWLPLQYALLPEDHDEPAEVDALLERATGVAFSEHNHLAYVANLQFHWELLRMIRETRRYHVLWVHDFPAITAAGTLDRASLTQVVDGYLATLASAAEAYDSAGTLPLFFILLDQHYYEGRKSRVLMDVLEDPLHASAALPGATLADTQRLAAALERLRRAVRGSRVLQAEAREYGAAWLRNRIKVHVNVTNRVDASFWSGGLISTVFGYPDDVMRDHRKIAFRDVSDEDPFSGVGILTGMGVGEHYLGPQWDDRSLVLQGPVLGDLKRAAAELLVSQGVRAADLPRLLRPAPANVRARRPETPPDATRFVSRAMAVVNETGYLAKTLNTAKALLYSLMPPGAVIKIPDSLWNATFYASLLVGATLRGATVLIVAPAESNAPSRGFPQMSRAHELFTRLLLVQRELGPAARAAGGALHVGLYALPVDRCGFASRAELWSRQVDAIPFLREMLPVAWEMKPAVDAAARCRSATTGPLDHHPPQLHQKVQFLATRGLWQRVGSSPHWPDFMGVYLRYREATYAPGDEGPEVRQLADSLALIAERMMAGDAAPAAGGYAILGSQNQDYRGIFMDGEVAVVFSGPAALVPLVDLVFLLGTVTWVTEQAILDQLIPPPGEWQRRIARAAKDGI